MGKIKIIYFLGLLVIIAGCTEKQNPDFITIHYVSFDVNSYRTPLKDKPGIAMYCEIDSNGTMKIVKDDEYNGRYQGSAAQLSPEQVTYIQSVFQEKNRLVNFVNEYKFEKNTELFAGSYKYIYVNYASGRKDSICTIVPFMSDSLQKFHDMFYCDSTIKTDTIIQPSPVFVKSMFNSFLINKWLPPISTLPAFRMEDNPQLGK